MPAEQGDWDGALYAANSEHHRATDDRLIADLALTPRSRVLDLGAGHGDLTAKIAALVPDGDVLGVDASAAMVATASDRHAAPNLRFLVLPAQRLSGVLEPASLDAVVSVACLHWVPRADHPAVLAGLVTALRHGGAFRADLGGHGQIAAVCEVVDAESAALGGPTAPWYFPDADEYRSLLEDAGFWVSRGHVRLLHQRRSFPDADAIRGYLRSQVVMAYDGDMDDDDRAELRRRVEARAVRDLRRSDGSYDLDYVRLDVLAHRPG